MTETKNAKKYLDRKYKKYVKGGRKDDKFFTELLQKGKIQAKGYKVVHSNKTKRQKANIKPAKNK